MAMHGYVGHHEWRSLYAVLYMTKQFYTQKEVEVEFEFVRAELSWKPIVVVGSGGRKLRAAAHRSVAGQA